MRITIKDLNRSLKELNELSKRKYYLYHDICGYVLKDYETEKSITGHQKTSAMEKTLCAMIEYIENDVK